MSITYNTISGDSFDTVARKKYGTALGLLIRSANPSVSEPIPPGTTLVIPDQPNSPKDQHGGAVSEGQDEVAILVGGELFRFWSIISVTRTIDQMDTFALSAPTTTAFKPLTFETVSITVGGTPLFTGTMLGVQPSVSASLQIDEVNGYSLPGVLNDCTMPSSAYPVEFNDQTLEQISKTLLLPFGITSVFVDPAGSTFDRVSMGEGEKVLAFLAKLAKQRNLVIGSETLGFLRFSSPNGEGNIVARLQQGTAPLVSINPLFNPQQYYSDVTGIEPVLVGLQGQKHTVKNDRLSSVVRPFTFVVHDAVQGGLKAVVEAKAARMFADAVKYTVDVATWRNAEGGLWSPGDTIQLDAPSAKVFGFFTFLIRSVTFRAMPNGRTASLDLVLPTVFSGGIPERMPWDE